MVSVLKKLFSVRYSPYDLRVMSNERDFKADLSHTQNLMLALGLSQRTVLLCSQDFIESELSQFESVAYGVMPEVYLPILIIMPLCLKLLTTISSSSHLVLH